MKTETLIYNQSQSWVAVRTLDLGTHRLRLTVRRNAYDAQSYAKTQRWDGEKWQDVETLPISLLPEETRAVSYVQAREKVETGLMAGLAFMHKRAAAFFAE